MLKAQDTTWGGSACPQNLVLPVKSPRGPEAAEPWKSRAGRPSRACAVRGPRAAAVTRQMLAAAPLQDQVRALAKTQTSASFQDEKYELASNRKICHLELSFSSVEWPVLVNAVG